LFIGWDGDGALASVERFSPEYGAWDFVAPLSTARCFVAGALLTSRHVMALGRSRGSRTAQGSKSPVWTSTHAGGGSSIWQGATVFRSTEVLDPDTETWSAGPAMHDARCGLSAAVSDGWERGES
jgi:hypothetical protein